jgi:putative oxidoreductase
MRFLDYLRPLGALVLRLGLAIIFVYHGYPKLFRDPQHFVDLFARVGLPFGSSYAIGLLELMGGALLAIGLFTRPVALLLSIEMGVALWKVHLAKGYLAVNEYEFPLMVGAGALALATFGPGPISIDQFLMPSKTPRSATGGGAAKPKAPKN